MPVDYYPNKSVAELQVILGKLQDRQTKGGITEVSAAGVRTTRKFDQQGNSRTETEILRILYSLHKRAPKDWDNPYADRIRRTRARYTYS